MKLHLSHPGGIHLVTAQGSGFIDIDHARHSSSLILLQDAIHTWPVHSFESLTREHFATLVAMAPELVLFGSGCQHRFPHPDLYRDLINTGIGVEIMSTEAACRTYNFLVADGRAVLAALIIETANPHEPGASAPDR